MRKTFRKAVSILLATAVVVSGVSMATGTTVSAAKKTKTYKVQTFMAGVQGKKAKVSITVKNPTKKKITAGTVFTIDLIGILKDYKKNKVKISGVTVKADGKKKSVKTKTGCFEPKTKPNNYRLSLYNKWGTDGDNSAQINKATKFAFKKTLTVSFTVVAK